MGNPNQRAVRDKVKGGYKLVNRKQPPHTDPVFKRLAAEVDRREIAEAAYSDGNERLTTFANMLLNPDWKRHSIAKIAKDCMLSYAEVLRAIQRFKIDQGMFRMARHTPQVMEDVAEDAKSRLVTCPSCEGHGRIEKVNRKGEVIAEKLCVTCDGVGKLRKIGDEASRKLLFETMGLTNKGRGPMVAVQVNNPQAMETSVEQVHEAISIPMEADDGGRSGGEGTK